MKFSSLSLSPDVVVGDNSYPAVEATCACGKKIILRPHMLDNARDCGCGIHSKPKQEIKKAPKLKASK